MCVFWAPGRELASLIPRDTWVVMVGSRYVRDCSEEK